MKVKNYLIDFMHDNELSIYEEFTFKEYPGYVHRIVDRTEEGKDLEYVVEYKFPDSGSMEFTSATAYTLSELLLGRLTVIKLPWKPKDDEKYYFVLIDGVVGDRYFDPNVPLDRLNYFARNCFKTVGEAIKNSKKITEEVFGGYERAE